MNIRTRIHASWLVGSVLSAKREWKEGKGVKQAKKKKDETDRVVRRARNIEEGYASLSALVTESSKYKNTLHVSWPRARMNSLKRSEPWTHIPIPFHMCLEYVGALASRTGKTSSVEYVIFINRTSPLVSKQSGDTLLFWCQLFTCISPS